MKATSPAASGDTEQQPNDGQSNDRNKASDRTNFPGPVAEFVRTQGRSEFSRIQLRQNIFRRSPKHSIYRPLGCSLVSHRLRIKCPCSDRARRPSISGKSDCSDCIPASFQILTQVVVAHRLCVKGNLSLEHPLSASSSLLLRTATRFSAICM